MKNNKLIIEVGEIYKYYDIDPDFEEGWEERFSDKVNLSNISYRQKLSEPFLIAYKNIRTDNYSHFNFQYKYEVGKVTRLIATALITKILSAYPLGLWRKRRIFKIMAKL